MEFINSIKVPLSLRPTTMDHPQSILGNKSFNYISDASTFSKVWKFCSLHKSHIKHNRMKFHTPNERFPNQFYQPTCKSITLHSIAQCSLKRLKSENIAPLGMAMGRGGAEGWDLRSRFAWIFLAPSPPRPAWRGKFLAPSPPLKAPRRPAKPRPTA